MYDICIYIGIHLSVFFVKSYPFRPRTDDIFRWDHWGCHHGFQNHAYWTLCHIRRCNDLNSHSASDHYPNPSIPHFLASRLGCRRLLCPQTTTRWPSYGSFIAFTSPVFSASNPYVNMCFSLCLIPWTICCDLPAVIWRLQICQLRPVPHAQSEFSRWEAVHHIGIFSFCQLRINSMALASYRERCPVKLPSPIHLFPCPGTITIIYLLPYSIFFINRAL